MNPFLPLYIYIYNCDYFLADNEERLVHIIVVGQLISFMYVVAYVLEATMFP